MQRPAAVQIRSCRGYSNPSSNVAHAAGHRIDIRCSSRHLAVRDGDQIAADTYAPLVLYESGFTPRWYVPRADPIEGRAFCPYKGVGVHEVGGIQLREEAVPAET